MNRPNVSRRLLAVAAALCALVPGSSQTASNGAARHAHVLQTPLDIVWADPRNMMYSSGPTESERLVAAAAFQSVAPQVEGGLYLVPKVIE